MLGIVLVLKIKVIRIETNPQTAIITARLIIAYSIRFRPFASLSSSAPAVTYCSTPHRKTTVPISTKNGITRLRLVDTVCNILSTVKFVLGLGVGVGLGDVGGTGTGGNPGGSPCAYRGYTGTRNPKRSTAAVIYIMVFPIVFIPCGYFNNNDIIFIIYSDLKKLSSTIIIAPVASIMDMPIMP
jgi:hypothetical protein